MKRRTLLLLPLLVLCCCTRERSCTRPPLAPVPAGAGLSVAFFDVGQGDAALLRTAEDVTVLFDTGPNGGIADLLRRERVSRIDLLVLSHDHADHAGGLAAVLGAVPVEEIWYAGELRARETRSAVRKARKTERVAAGKTARIGNLTLTVLHPQPNGVRRGRATDADVNNASLVVKAAYGDNRYLFPGDCELGCWERMFKTRRPELRADVLKAAHHGSWNATNSGVLGSVRPSTVVISCAKGNPYGHPHPVVLKLLDRLGAKVFRTDLEGTIRCAGIECRAGR
jgi:competence protein ComEC